MGSQSEIKMISTQEKVCQCRWDIGYLQGDWLGKYIKDHGAKFLTVGGESYTLEMEKMRINPASNRNWMYLYEPMVFNIYG